MTHDTFRQIALGLSGAVEGAHMGHPDFRANGRIFATLSADGRKGMVWLTPADQKEFVAANRGVFDPASGAWGRQGCTMVALGKADEEVVGEAMTLAWRNRAKAGAPKKVRRTKESPAGAGRRRAQDGPERRRRAAGRDKR